MIDDVRVSALLVRSPGRRESLSLSAAGTLLLFVFQSLQLALQAPDVLNCKVQHVRGARLLIRYSDPMHLHYCCVPRAGLQVLAS